MNKQVHRFIVVRVKDVVNVRNSAKTILGAEGDNMFISSYSSTGNAPPTHYISSGFVDITFVNHIDANYPDVIMQADANGYELIALQLMGLKQCPDI